MDLRFEPGGLHDVGPGAPAGQVDRSCTLFGKGHAAFSAWLSEVLEAERSAVAWELESRHKQLINTLDSGRHPTALPGLGSSHTPREQPATGKGRAAAHVQPSKGTSAASERSSEPVAAAAILRQAATDDGAPLVCTIAVPGAVLDQEPDQSTTATVGAHSQIGCLCAPPAPAEQRYAEAAAKLHGHPAPLDLEVASEEQSPALGPRSRSSSSTKLSPGLLVRDVSHLVFLRRDTEKLSALTRFVNSLQFESACAVVVVVLAIFMAFELQYQGLDIGFELRYSGYAAPAGETWAWAAPVFDALNWVFGIYFCLEVGLKLAGLGRRAFCDAWNTFDLLVTMLWAIETVGDNFLPSGVDASFFRVVRLLRLARFIRLVKTMRSMDALYLIRTALLHSRAALVWSCVILFLFQVLVAFFLNQLLALIFFHDDAYPREQRREVFKYFGTFSRALLSTFEMTLANWPPVCRLLAENVSEWFVMVCLFHKLTIGFALVGVINGVFIQETFKCAQDDDLLIIRQKERATATHIRKMKKLFASADEDGNGYLDKDEFHHVLQHEDVRTWLAAMDYDLDDTAVLFDMLDTDRSGFISPQEFVKGITRLRGAAKSVDVKKLLNPEFALRSPVANPAGTTCMFLRQPSP